jgi:hypothetical protein
VDGREVAILEGGEAPADGAVQGDRRFAVGIGQAVRRGGQAGEHPEQGILERGRQVAEDELVDIVEERIGRRGPARLAGAEDAVLGDGIVQVGVPAEAADLGEAVGDLGEVDHRRRRFEQIDDAAGPGVQPEERCGHAALRSPATRRRPSSVISASVGRPADVVQRRRPRSTRPATVASEIARPQPRTRQQEVVA